MPWLDYLKSMTASWTLHYWSQTHWKERKNPGFSPLYFITYTIGTKETQHFQGNTWWNNLPAQIDKKKRAKTVFHLSFLLETGPLKSVSNGKPTVLYSSTCMLVILMYTYHVGCVSRNCETHIQYFIRRIFYHLLTLKKTHSIQVHHQDTTWKEFSDRWPCSWTLAEMYELI